jgi:tRNA (guanine37-N1)-methyltransferase
LNLFLTMITGLPVYCTNLDQIIESILPDNVPVPSSFETVGHIAHLNLKPEHEPFKFIIGQVLIDKLRNIKTVVNKVGNIQNMFRVFEMQVLAGNDDLATQVTESGCRFNFDFGLVYWNSRLSTEHHRLVSLLQKSDLVCDLFAGVGPFAIPIAKKGATVFANDLNPNSYKYLMENIKQNHVTHFKSGCCKCLRIQHGCSRIYRRFFGAPKSDHRK